jgi:hypothetical protein
MPIRFRCAYCNQLMGIARRKAGTVVRCPKCAGQVVVPHPEGYDDGPDPSEQPVAHQPMPAGQVHGSGGGLAAKVFEHNDFAKVFEDDGAPAPLAPLPPAAPPAAHPRPAPADSASEYDAIRLSPTTKARGVFMTSGLLAVFAALVIILMGMAFFLGVLLGRSMS